MKYFSAIMLLSFFFSCSSTGQIKNTIKKSASFITERQRGNIPVDRSGNPMLPLVDTAIQVLVETTTQKINWDTAWFNGKVYLLTVQQVAQQKKHDSENNEAKINNERPFLQTAPGNYLWYLILSPLEAAQPPVPKKVSQSGNGEVIIGGKYKGIAFLHKAGKPTQLEAIPSM